MSAEILQLKESMTKPPSQLKLIMELFKKRKTEKGDLTELRSFPSSFADLKLTDSVSLAFAPKNGNLQFSVEGLNKMVEETASWLIENGVKIERNDIHSAESFQSGTFIFPSTPKGITFPHISICDVLGREINTTKIDVKDVAGTRYVQQNDEVTVELRQESTEKPIFRLIGISIYPNEKIMNVTRCFSKDNSEFELKSPRWITGKELNRFNKIHKI
jgi:hypothetical protein